jgi:hypothetical protein
VLPFTIPLDSTKSIASSSSQKYDRTPNNADESSSSDTSISRDFSQVGKPAVAAAAAAVSSATGTSADASATKNDQKNSAHGDTVLRVLLTFKQLQLLPAASVTSDAAVTSDTSDTAGSRSDIRQVDQQPSSSSAALEQPTGPATESSCSTIGSQAQPSLEPHHKNAAVEPIAATTNSSSSAATKPPGPSSALTDSLKQLALNDSSSSSTPSNTAAAAAAEPATAHPAAAAGIPTAAAAAAAAPVIERRLEAVLLSTAPRLLVVDDFFDAGLCAGLMNLANDKLVRSRVASGAQIQ